MSKWILPQPTLVWPEPSNPEIDEIRSSITIQLNNWYDKEIRSLFDGGQIVYDFMEKGRTVFIIDVPPVFNQKLQTFLEKIKLFLTKRGSSNT